MFRAWKNNLSLKMWLTVGVLVVLLATIGLIRSLSYPHPITHEIQWASYVRQPDGITCGPTSATMVLRHYGQQVQVDEVKAHTKTEWIQWGGKPIGMTSPEYIPEALKHFGVPSFLTQANLRQLKHYIGKDLPCIVLLRSGPYTWHYVVATGYTEDSVIFADPGCGARITIDNDAFLGAWSFETDMRGDRVAIQCKICNGTGRWANLGPLSTCGVCDGSGEVSGILTGLLKTAEVYPHTIIVPRLDIRNNRR